MYTKLILLQWWCAMESCPFKDEYELRPDSCTEFNSQSIDTKTTRPHYLPCKDYSEHLFFKILI